MWGKVPFPILSLLRLPPFAKCAKDGPPRVLLMSAREQKTPQLAENHHPWLRSGISAKSGRLAF